MRITCNTKLSHDNKYINNISSKKNKTQKLKYIFKKINFLNAEFCFELIAPLFELYFCINYIISINISQRQTDFTPKIINIEVIL